MEGNVDSLITQRGFRDAGQWRNVQDSSRSDILDSLFSRKVRLFGHFEGWSVDTLTAAVSKLQTSASAVADFELAP